MPERQGGSRGQGAGSRESGGESGSDPPGMVDLALLARKTGNSVEDVRTVLYALGGQPTLLQKEAVP